VNALRDIETVSEIEVRLQTNEVLVHLPKDTALGKVPEAIFEAGYKPDQTVELLARGTWTASGFLPQGWSQAVPATPPEPAGPGQWRLVYALEDGSWKFQSATPLAAVPQIIDEDAR
jgi:hypothetical protein